MRSKYVLLVCVSINFATIVWWKSPFSIALKCYYAMKLHDDSLLLDAAELARRFRSGSEGSRRAVIDFKLGVAERQMTDAGRLVDELIANKPRDPRLFVFRARFHILNGRVDRALTDLATAKELIVSGALNDEFTPTPNVIDDMIEAINAHMGREHKGTDTLCFSRSHPRWPINYQWRWKAKCYE